MQRAFFEKAHKKLSRITATTEDRVSTHVIAGVLTWDDAMRMMPEWADPYVFHRDDPDILLPENRGQVLIQRVIERGPSYMHAPVVLQHCQSS